MNVGSQYGLCSIMEKYNNVCFIFCTNHHEHIIESIQSRCYPFPFQKINKSELRDYVITILEKENKKYSEDIFDILYDFTKGDVRKYITNLQSSSYQSDFITKEHVLKVIKKPFSNTMQKIIEFTQKNDRVTCMKDINILLDQGYNHGDVIKYLFDYCVDCNIEQNLKLKYLDKIGQAQIGNARGLYSNIQMDYLMIQLCELND